MRQRLILLGAVVLLVLILAGCSDAQMEEVRAAHMIVDQCKREELFQACMKALPAGPVATQYNDWSEVVDECGSHAYYTALRRRDHVPVQCRAD